MRRSAGVLIGLSSPGHCFTGPSRRSQVRVCRRVSPRPFKGAREQGASLVPVVTFATGFVVMMLFMDLSADLACGELFCVDIPVSGIGGRRSHDLVEVASRHILCGRPYHVCRGNCPRDSHRSRTVVRAEWGSRGSVV